MSFGNKDGIKHCSCLGENYDCGGVVLVVLDIPCDKGRIKTLLFSDGY